MTRIKCLNDTCHSFLRVPPFKASKYLITNREYLEFVNDGGYKNPKHWTKEGENFEDFRLYCGVGFLCLVVSLFLGHQLDLTGTLNLAKCNFWRG